MSSGGKTAKGGKGKGDANSATSGSNKPAKVDNIKAEVTKSTVDNVNKKFQPTAEQMRIAQIIEPRTDDSDMKEKVRQVIELTNKSEEEVCAALHDCDGDTSCAINMLLEGEGQGEWEQSRRRRKNRQQSSSKADGATTGTTPNANTTNNKEKDDWDSDPKEAPVVEKDKERDRDRDRSRGRGGGGGGGPPRLRGRGGGWRGRENKENEKNLAEEPSERGNDGSFRGRRGGRAMNGPSRGGRGGGRGGGRLGSRTFQNREKGDDFPNSIDIWNNTQANANSGDALKVEDWDNEEYTGSLADTKVFTPSTVAAPLPANTVSVSHPATATNVVPGQVTNAFGEPLQDATNSVSKGYGGDPSTAEPMQQSIDLAALLQPSQNQSSGSMASGLLPSQSSGAFNLSNSLNQQATDALKAAVGVATIGSSSVGTTAPSYAGSAAVANSYSTSAPNVYQPSNFGSSGVPYSNAAFGSSNYGNQSKMSVTTSAVSSHISTSTSGSQGQGLQQRVKTQRARVPPPSKIPSSAVEMPDDAITSLDVQFGGLEFGSESGTLDFGSSLDQSSKFTSSDTSNGAGSATVVMGTKPNLIDVFGSGGGAASQGKDHGQPGGTGISIPPSLSQTQKIGASDNLSYPSNTPADRKAASSHYGSQRSAASGGSVSATDGTPGDGSNAYGFTGSASHYGSNYSSQKSYSVSSNYGANQVPTSTPYTSGQPQNSTFSTNQSSGTYTQQGPGSFSSQQQASTQQPSYSSNQSAGSFSSAQPPSSFASLGQSAGTYPSGTSSQTASGGYQSGNNSSNQANSSVTGSGYSSQSSYSGTGSSSYPSNQSGSGSYQSANQTTGYSSSNHSSGTVQYSSGFGGVSSSTTSHTNLHTTGMSGGKLGGGLVVKDNQYDMSTVSTSSLTSTLTATSTALGSATAGLGLTATTTSSSSKLAGPAPAVPSVSAGGNKTGNMPSMPPGVPAAAAVLGGQYILGQPATGLPIYGLQQPLYSYDELPMQMRLPHLAAASYYDMSFQAQTNLQTGRDAGLANVPYSGSDSRFARTDNNSSPIPSTLAQQTATHSHQPILNASHMPPYAYFYGAGMVPGNFQYGTPLYPMPTATSTHGVSTNTQFQKPGGYGSTYSNAYDNLNQTQEFKSSYVSNSQSQGKGGTGTTGGGSSSTDLSNTVYGKTQLGKMNSYDKQVFHSATPPPLNLAGTPMGAPSGAYAGMYIPSVAPHQQHHSPLMHAPLHQDASNAGGQRSQSGGQQGKGTKNPTFTQYWSQN